MSEQLAIDFLSHRARSTRRNVFRILTCHRGRAQAISMHEIAQRLGISSRDVQAIVKHLVEDKHLPIGTAVSRPFGYYWITSERERRDCRNHFLRRALSILDHAKAYDADGIVAPLVGQFPLNLDGDDK